MLEFHPLLLSVEGEVTEGYRWLWMILSGIWWGLHSYPGVEGVSELLMVFDFPI
jgi:hypothetical protein